MSQQTLKSADKVLLKAYEDSWAATHSSREALYLNGNQLEVARFLLESKPKALSTWAFLERLKSDELIDLIEILVKLATHTSHEIVFAIPILLRIPKHWLMENLDKYFEPLLGQNHGESYIAIIELYKRLDLGKAYYWANRASQHGNTDIQQIGDEYLGQFKKISKDL